jgi:hypothetical protein
MRLFKELPNIDLECLRQSIKGLEVGRIPAALNALVVAVAVTKGNHAFLGQPPGISNPDDVSSHSLKELFVGFVLHTRMVPAAHKSNHDVTCSRICLILRHSRSDKSLKIRSGAPWHQPCFIEGMKTNFLGVLSLTLPLALIVCMSGCGGSNSESAGSDGATGPAGLSASTPSNGPTVEANGNAIGSWLGNVGADEINVQLSSGYFFSLDAPTDGISTTAQVASQVLYYTSANCSGTPYVMDNVYSGDIFVGYGAINTPSLFYASKSSNFSQLQALSQRSATQSTYAIINFNGTPTSGVYTLNFNGESTANINWNDSASQIQTKILAGIPAFASVSVIQDTSLISVQYQTSSQNDGLAFTVTGNTLETNGAALPTTVTMYDTMPGACASASFLNQALTPVQLNDSSVTGLSTMSFPQPITIN